jgi:hypothetical protein
LRRYHPTLFPHLLRSGWFNARRSILGLLIDQVRRTVIHHWGLIALDEPNRLIDSTPILLCTYAHASQNQTMRGSEYFDNRTRLPWSEPVRRLLDGACRQIETAFSILTTVFESVQVKSARMVSLRGY